MKLVLPKLFLFVLFVLSIPPIGWGVAYAQTPDWLWAKGAGGTSNDYGKSISTDGSGNVYVTGYFGSSFITFGSATLTNGDNIGNTSEIFLVKYDASGNVLWAKSVGGTNGDFGQSIATDASGNVYVTGEFGSPSIIFGSDTLTNANSGYYNIFTVKYDSSGNVLWAKSAGGTSHDYGKSIATDASGNSYVTGEFYSPFITFGSYTLNNAVSGYTDIFIVKYDSNGNVLWAKSAGGTDYDYGQSIVTDASGNVYVTGYFGNFPIIFGSNTLTNAGGNDIFTVKYDSNGNVLWAKSAGGTNDDEGCSIATDASGNVYVTGYFYSSSITFGSTTLTKAGGYDIFTVKYDSNGNILWAKSAGGTSYDYGKSISTDASGNVYVTGDFQSSSITFGSATLTNTGYADIFVLKYDSSGNALWAKSAGGTFVDYGRSIATDAIGNVYVTGYFEYSSITFGSYTLTNAGGNDVFVAKLSGLVGLEELNGENKEVRVFPNPNDGKFVVQINQYEFNDNKKYELKIYNVLGEMVYQSGIQYPVSSIQTNLASGVYYVQVISEKEALTKKVVVE